MDLLITTLSAFLIWGAIMLQNLRKPGEWYTDRNFAIILCQAILTATALILASGTNLEIR